MSDYELVFTQQARHVLQFFGINFDDIIEQRLDLLKRDKLPAKIILPQRSLFGCRLEFSDHVNTPVVVEAGPEL